MRFPVMVPVVVLVLASVAVSCIPLEPSSATALRASGEHVVAAHGAGNTNTCL